MPVDATHVSKLGLYGTTQRLPGDFTGKSEAVADRRLITIGVLTRITDVRGFVKFWRRKSNNAGIVDEYGCHRGHT